MKPFDGFTQIRLMEFDEESMWIQLHNLPLAGMNRLSGERIGSSIGRVEEVDVEDDDIGWGSYLQVKVCLKLTKPIAHGRTITIKGLKIWVLIK